MSTEDGEKAVRGAGTGVGPVISKPTDRPMMVA